MAFAVRSSRPTLTVLTVVSTISLPLTFPHVRPDSYTKRAVSRVICVFDSRQLHHFQPRVARQVDVDMLGLPIAAEEFMRRSGS